MRKIFAPHAPIRRRPVAHEGFPGSRVEAALMGRLDEQRPERLHVAAGRHHALDQRLGPAVALLEIRARFFLGGDRHRRLMRKTLDFSGDLPHVGRIGETRGKLRARVFRMHLAGHAHQDARFVLAPRAIFRGVGGRFLVRHGGGLDRSLRGDPLPLLVSTAVHLHAGHQRDLPVRGGTLTLRGQRQLLIACLRLATFFHAFFPDPLRGPPHALGKQLQLAELIQRFRGAAEN